MLQLVARYADQWNTAWHTDAAVVQERYAQLQAACAEVGRDAATITLTVGTSVNLQPAAGSETGQAITGSPAEIAQRLHAFAGVGVAHLIVELEPLTPKTIEEFGRIVEMARALK